MTGNSQRDGSTLDTLRLPWPDVCRAISIFGVILIHASIDTFKQFGVIPLSDWLVANLINSFIRCSVPLFVMLSGALLLKADVQMHEFTVRQIFRRIGKVAFPLLSWNVAYLLYLSYHSGESVKWMSMLSHEPAYHLWFVYMIIGIYILLPVLQVIYNLISFNKNLKIYLFAVWFVVTCIPVYQPMPLLTLLQQESLFGYGGYFLIGGVIASSSNKKYSNSFWIFIYLIGVAATFLLTFYFSTKAHSAIEDAYVVFTPNVFISSVAAFILFTRIDIKKRFLFVFQWISDRSFLVFLMHVVVLERVIRIIDYLLPMLPIYLLILFSALVTFFICLLIAAALRLLPGSREIIG